ncbi:MAG: SDR family oxidoreductase [Proteobacteria bacterium]|nr:SDR family oxidoreductase [Pseudomonadota bacterium]
MTDLSSKTIVITGASSGIGEATARLLAGHGAKVLVGARRTDRLAALVAGIEKSGGKAAYQAVDVSDAASVKSLVDFAVKTFGRIDVMFNNAGLMPVSPTNAYKLDEWHAMIDVNVKGVLHGIAAALPLMEAQGSGHIINTASTGAHAVGPSFGVYCATKYAVWAISEGLRQEMDKIRVTVLSPGVTTTKLGHDITDKASADAIVALRQASMTPEAVAKAVLYAIAQPDDVEIGEIVMRSTRSAGHAF